MKPLFIKEFLPQQLLNFLNSYVIMKYANEEPDFKNIQETGYLIGTAIDPVMDTLLDMSTSVIENNVGKKLWPTYSYFRIYDKGSDLKVHTDRTACEYTVALCLGCSPNDKPYDLFIGEIDLNSDYKYFNRKKEGVPLKIEHKYSMLPNNALIFQGLDKPHWREECIHDHYNTVFLHYVDQEGEYADFKYDKREQLGQSRQKSGN